MEIKAIHQHLEAPKRASIKLFWNRPSFQNQRVRQQIRIHRLRQKGFQVE